MKLKTAGETIELEEFEREWRKTLPKYLLANGDSNTKLRKSGPEYLTLGLSLAPHKSLGYGNVCPWASLGCIASCLDHQGLGSVFASIHKGRKLRTELFYSQRGWFLSKLHDEIGNKLRIAKRAGKTLAIRLNVFSDIKWEYISPRLFADFPEVEFYDYSKSPTRFGSVLPNYWVTFSRSEDNEADCIRILRAGGNVAVVFADARRPLVGNQAGKQRMPASWKGFRVIDGNSSDLRFEDERAFTYIPKAFRKGFVVGLKLKAHSHAEREAAIASGFAVKYRSRKP